MCFWWLDVVRWLTVVSSIWSLFLCVLFVVFIVSWLLYVATCCCLVFALVGCCCYVLVVVGVCVVRCYLPCVRCWVLFDVFVASYGCLWFVVCRFALFNGLIVCCGVLLRIGSGRLH